MSQNEDILKLVKEYGKFPKKFGIDSYIPIASALYDEKEIIALVKSALEMRMVDGELSYIFERDFSRYLGVKYATFCNSGSSANLLALMALTSPKLKRRSLQYGDEVITSAVGFPTTVSPILLAGCVPIWTDVSLSTYNPTPTMIADAITDKTKAIFLAHTLGNPLEMDEIKEIAIQNDLWIIEDCADALGSEYKNEKVGTYGDIATTSFYPAHMITTGEGGMVFTNNPMLNALVRSFRDWGRSCYCAPGKDNTCGHRFTQKEKGELPTGYDHKYTYDHIGFNLKSTDLQASIGIEQLKKLPDFIETRRHNWQFMYDTFLQYGLDKYFILPKKTPNSDPAWFGFVLTLRDDVKFTRSDIVSYLESMRIGTRNLFGGNLTKQPAFSGKGRVADELSNLSKSNKVMNDTFWIGIHPNITEEIIDYIADSFLKFIEMKYG